MLTNESVVFSSSTNDSVIVDYSSASSNELFPHLLIELVLIALTLFSSVVVGVQYKRRRNRLIASFRDERAHEEVPARS